MFESISLTRQTPAAPADLPERLLRERIRVQIRFMREREHDTAAVLLTLGLDEGAPWETVLEVLRDAPISILLHTWRKCRRRMPRDPVESSELDRVASAAVLDEFWRYRNERNRPAGVLGIVGTTGIALSGGGIRSASFCLGVLGELARRKLLRTVDYISAVSGGGYIASWLVTWAYRHPRGMAGVEEALGGGSDVPGPVRWLRRYAVYLAPRFGIFAPDMWSLGMTYLRNTLPILCITLPLLAGILAVPHLALRIEEMASGWMKPFSPDPLSRDFWLGAPGAVILPLIAVSWVVRRYSLFTVGGYTEALGKLIPVLMIGVLIAAMIVAVGLSSMPIGKEPIIPWWIFPVGGSLLQLAASAMAVSAVSDDILAQNQPQRRDRVIALVTAAVVAGAVAGLGLLLAYVTLAGANGAAVIAYGPLLIVLGVGLGEIAFITYLTPVADDVDRAWWSRTAAYAVLPPVAWFGLCTLTLGSEALPRGLLAGAVSETHWILWAALGTGAVVALATAALAIARSARWRARAALMTKKVALLLVAGAILSALGGAVSLIINMLMEFAYPADTADATARLVVAAAFCLAALSMATLISIRVNLNRSSLHGLYRDGLIRTFLGASRHSPPNTQVALEGVREAEQRQGEERKPERFTDIDDDDNPAIAWLRPGRSPGRKLPMLLINASVNGLVPGRRPGREARQYSFTFGPLHCGSSAPGVGYTSTKRFFTKSPLDKKLTLGTAMAVSGAAVSPHAGRNESPIMSFLLTLINARVGLWIGNPSYRDALPKPSPTVGLPYLARELFGLREGFGRWIHLSDGGHFENIGLYELVRRRCQRIIVVDASCDPKRGFSDIGDAIRRIRIDLNVEVEPFGQWRIGEPNRGNEGREWATFQIRYAGAALGRMLYIKPSLYDNSASALPMDVLEYWARNAEFPHETTANQFFSEAQLEAYRKLGQFCAERALSGVFDDPYDKSWSNWLAASLSDDVK